MPQLAWVQVLHSLTVTVRTCQELTKLESELLTMRVRAQHPAVMPHIADVPLHAGGALRGTSASDEEAADILVASIVAHTPTAAASVPSLSLTLVQPSPACSDSRPNNVPATHPRKHMYTTRTHTPPHHTHAAHPRRTHTRHVLPTPTTANVIS
jgi:hypothetical protein